jgi:hypothetical protein
MIQITTTKSPLNKKQINANNPMMPNLEDFELGLAVFICSLGVAIYRYRSSAGTFSPRAIVGDVEASIKQPSPVPLTHSMEWARLAITIDNYLARAQQIARAHTAAMLQLDATEHALNCLLREMATATSMPRQPLLMKPPKFSVVSDATRARQLSKFNAAAPTATTSAAALLAATSAPSGRSSGLESTAQPYRVVNR